MPNQIEKLISALEELEPHAPYMLVKDLPQLLKILKAHKFLLEGVEEARPKLANYLCGEHKKLFKHIDNLIKTHNEML